MALAPLPPAQQPVVGIQPPSQQYIQYWQSLDAAVRSVTSFPGLAANYIWTGTHTFDGVVTVNAASTFNDPVTIKALATAWAINGVGYIAPGVNGVFGNGSTDDTAAIQAILTAYPHIQWDPGVYLISSTLIVDLTKSPRIYGSGTASAPSGATGQTIILAAASFTGTAALSLQAAGGYGLDFVVNGISVINQTAGSGPSYGVQCVSTSVNNYWSANGKAVIEGITASGFAFNALQRGCRQLAWRRCATNCVDYSNNPTSGETGLYIYVTNSGSFTGDTDFDFEITSSASGNGVVITDQGFANCVLAGMRFGPLDVYSGVQQFAIDISGTSSAASDIWVNPGCQFEGSGSGYSINMAATGSGSSINDVHIDGIYAGGSGNLTHVKGTVANGGTIRRIWVINSWLANNVDGSVDIRGTGGSASAVHCSNNTNYGNNNSGGVIFYFENVVVVNAHNNIGTTPGSVGSYLVQFTGTATDYIAAQGNNSGGAASSSVNNSSSATHIAILSGSNI